LLLGVALLALAACRKPVAAPLDHLRVVLPSAVSTLDPHVAYTTAALTLLGNVYEPLIRADPGLGLRPGLARSWSNPDPLTWDLELQPGLTFHSGQPFEARDAAFSIERILSSPDLEIGYYLGDVASAEALGPHSLRLHLRRRSAALLNKLGHVLMVRAGSTSASLAAAADGTGPYRVVEWRPGRFAELRARDGDRRGKPAISRVSLRIDVPPGEIVSTLASRAADMGLVGLRRVDAAALGTFNLHRRGSLQVKYLGFDLAPGTPACCPGRANPFVDRRVREAIQLTLDRNRLVAGLPSHAAPANQLVPRHVFGFNASLPEARNDPERARALLAAAGFGQGLTGVLHTRQILEEAGELVRSQLASVGIGLELVVLPDPEYFAALKRREFTLWLDRWSCTTGDAGELFENALHSPQPARGLGAFNESGYSNPVLDGAIEKALVLEDLPSRRRALEDLMRQVMEELVWIPLYTDEEVWAVDKGFTWRPGSDYWLHLSDVTPMAEASR
jgi:peptide/nickel transport system substrate-binding protein